MTISSLERSRLRFVAIVIIPTVGFYLIFHYFPFVYALTMSMFNWSPLSGTGAFVGLRHYANAITSNSVFMVSLKNTLVFTGATVLLRTVIALGFALIIYSLPKTRRNLFRALFFIPVVSSMIAVSTAWKLILQPRFGILNNTIDAVFRLLSIGSIEPIRWLTSPDLAMASVIGLVIWKSLGNVIVLFLVGLGSIPRDYYECAEIDGASWWQSFRLITFPMLLPITFFVMVTGTIGAMQAFGSIFVMTQGGPVHATTTLVYLIYQQAFVSFRFGSASAVTFLLFVAIMILTLIQFRLRGKQ